MASHIRQGIKLLATAKNNKSAKYKMKYTYAQGIKTKNNTTTKYKYSSKKIIYVGGKKKYSYKYS